ncbi:hypothetical protein [Streptomyces sp. ODS28]|uniref:hypothetical protein n=1 Tax=Streptomyces sp. ODS28 TaxID=3136688 RepID=UPI0031E694E4
MRLRVNAYDLEGYARMIERAADHVLAAHAYTNKHGVIEKEARGLFLSVFVKHDDVLSDVSHLLKRLRIVLEKSSAELTRSASYYRHTDFTVAENFDSTLDRTKR